MARVDLRCTSCGYQFFVSDAQLAKPEGVKCPSCLAPVGITGPAAGGPARKPGRVLEGSSDPGAANLKLWIGIGAVGLVVVIAAAVFLMGGSPPPAPLEEPVSSGARPLAGAKPAAVKKEPEKAAPATAPEKKPVQAAPAAAPKPAAQPAARVVPDLPADLLKNVRENVLSLKEWHLNLALSAPEKTRMEALLAAGKGEKEEVEFLLGILNGPRLRAVREESTAIAEAHATHEKEALEGLPVDLVVMNDGRKLHGKLVEQTPDLVKLERKIAKGSLVVTPLPRPGIKEVLAGKGLGAEFKKRWEEARKAGAPAYGAVLAWCKENSLSLQAALAAYSILVEDPGRSEARQEVGFATDPIARMVEADKQGGFILHEGRRWVPTELRDKLLRDNYVLLGGQWKSRKPFMASVGALQRYESQAVKPVQITGTLAREEVVTYNQMGDNWDKPDLKVLRTFYTAADRPIEVAVVRYHPERFRYVVQLG